MHVPANAWLTAVCTPTSARPCWQPPARHQAQASASWRGRQTWPCRPLRWLRLPRQMLVQRQHLPRPWWRQQRLPRRRLPRRRLPHRPLLPRQTPCPLQRRLHPPRLRPQRQCPLSCPCRPAPAPAPAPAPSPTARRLPPLLPSPPLPPLPPPPPPLQPMTSPHQQQPAGSLCSHQPCKPGTARHRAGFFMRAKCCAASQSSAAGHHVAHYAVKHLFRKSSIRHKIQD